VRKRVANLAPAVSIFTTVARIAVAILVVVETTTRDLQTSSRECARARIGAKAATFAGDRAEKLEINVLLLGVARMLRPPSAIELAILEVVLGANRAAQARLRISQSQLAAVSPITISVSAEVSVVADNRALLNTGL